MIRLIFTIVLYALAFVSMGANDCGSPTQVYDCRGWKMLLDVYGEVIECRGDRSLVPFRYPGQHEDVETRLYYNRFRYYSPEMAIYISSDPVGIAGNKVYDDLSKVRGNEEDIKETLGSLGEIFSQGGF